MRCGQARGQLHQYIDGRLPATRLGALEGQLAECAACRRELLLLEAIGKAVAGDVWQPEPPHLTALILARVATYEAERRGVPAHARAKTRSGFAPRWGDAVLAGVLA